MPPAPRWAIDWRSSRQRRAPVSADVALRCGRFADRRRTHTPIAARRPSPIGSSDHLRADRQRTLRRSSPAPSPIGSSDHLRADRQRTLRRSSPAPSPIGSSDHLRADRQRTLRRSSPAPSPIGSSDHLRAEAGLIGVQPTHRSLTAIADRPDLTRSAGRHQSVLQGRSPCRHAVHTCSAATGGAAHQMGRARGDHHVAKRPTSLFATIGGATHHMGRAIARQRRVAARLRDGSTRGCAIGASGSN